jgi:hypothetical protein
MYITYNVTDLINALLDSSSVNTVQHATVKGAVFSVDPTEGPIDWLDSGYVTCVSCDACPFLGYIGERMRSIQGRVSSR